MRIAIIGTGIAGLVCAHLLHPIADIVVYEASDRVGGHVNTINVQEGERTHAIDTGFIVFNDRTYPGFVRLLDDLGVASQPSTMSFSVSCERTGLEYNGTSIDTLFAQRRNIANPRFLRMVADILRFNRAAPAILSPGHPFHGATLRAYLDSASYSREFIERYLIPIGASIWSANPSLFDGIPASYFVSFLLNHGMLSINDRPQWRVVKGGSHRYVEALIRPFADRIRLGTPVSSILREGDSVVVRDRTGATESFDHTIVAAHSDQALAMLADPSEAEREVLAAIPYQANDTILHTHAGILPANRKAWAAWNYRIPAHRTQAVPITYNANILQSLDARETYCTTLNRGEEIPSAKVIRRISYEHPVYTSASVAAQRRWDEINGVRRTWFAGAYWGFGFHEDGLQSALRVCAHFGRGLSWPARHAPITHPLAASASHSKMEANRSF